MARKNNRKCIICGKNYSFCPTCGSDSGKPSWYFIFDSENCHDIYDICVTYRDKEIAIKEAYEKISKLDLAGLDNFVESTKAQIEEILAYKKTLEEMTTQVEVKESVQKTNVGKNYKNKK